MKLSGTALRAAGLRRDYGRGDAAVSAVDGVDLTVTGGELVAIVGPSGCGKSTLLYLLGGLERPSAGTLWLAGEQLDHLVEELTALENVELPARLAGASPRAARRRAVELLDQVGLSDRARHLPSELSGGQRQRAAVARALANEPAVVFADEPTGNLDSAATTEVLRLFDELHANGQTLVIVTHDERIAATADRLISMRDGAFVDETRLTNGTARPLSAIAGLQG